MEIFKISIYLFGIIPLKLTLKNKVTQNYNLLKSNIDVHSTLSNSYIN